MAHRMLPTAPFDSSSVATQHDQEQQQQQQA